MAYKQKGWSPFTKPNDKKKKFKKKRTGDLHTPPDTVRVSSKYKVGDWVSEDDLEGAFSQKGSDPKNYPQLSVQDYSKVKKDKKGNYVVGLRKKKKKTALKKVKDKSKKKLYKDIQKLTPTGGSQVPEKKAVEFNKWSDDKLPMSPTVRPSMHQFNIGGVGKIPRSEVLARKNKMIQQYKDEKITKKMKSLHNTPGFTPKKRKKKK